MRKQILVLLIILSSSASAQKFTFSGSVRDSLSGEALIGAYIWLPEARAGCTTNSYGFFSLTIPQGEYNAKFSYLGYCDKSLRVKLFAPVSRNIELRPNSVALSEVTIKAESGNRNVTSTEMSTQKLDIKDIRSIPVLLGEQDILKTLQLLPGVKSAGEGNSGFYVRGGTADQNLVLLDEAPVYNTSHLLGFFSVFNSDAVKDVKLYKSGIPAEYGGHLSSVIDVRMNDGNYKDYTVSGGIGLISSRLAVEGPIVKDKGSFIITGRRTYADLFLKLARDSNQRRSKAYFYDLNLKANYRLGEKDHIFLSGYLGRDVFNFGGRFGIQWGNTTSTLRENHLFSDRLFLNSSLIFSDYNYIITLEGINRSVDISSGIRDFNLKEDFQFYPSPGNTIKFGFNSAYHIFFPGTMNSTNNSTLRSVILQERHALESGIYFSQEYSVNSSLTINYGLRVSLFTVLGPGTFYSYDQEGFRTDSSKYTKVAVIKNYPGLEPRFSMTYVFDPSNSVKASYQRIYQYLHLLSNTTSGNPTDLWLPTSNNILPQWADQVSVGYFRNLGNNNYETSVEVYYKGMHNLIDYKPAADIVLNPDVESQLLYGRGKAYGAEFFIKKKEGSLTGWISYTLSRTLREFSGIDNGKSFPAKQDRIHDISVVAMYKIARGWTFTSEWVFYTGDAVTFPSGIYEIDGIRTPLYTERNGYRMPDYHRLDIGATHVKKLKENRERSWIFSVYNVYARKNAYSITFRQNPDNPSEMQAVRLSLFSVVPSITFNFKF
ncbi:MAG TPA: TonB-dependent receptor [Bacteroidales bacterium]|nr:TonB-dependent receptor [Bacteroidales bacterium]